MSTRADAVRAGVVVNQDPLRPIVLIGACSCGRSDRSIPDGPGHLVLPFITGVKTKVQE